MKVAIINFPGSNIEELQHVYGTLLPHEPQIIDHRSENLNSPDAVIVPGGYSFGDYLRPAGLAKVSRICGALRIYANGGGPVLGIGNGFQLLCELGLLPGALLPNESNRFASGDCHILVSNNKTPFTKGCKRKVLRMPIACYSGSYYADYRTLRDLEEGNLICFRFSDEEGELDAESNPTGSVNSIAGVVSRQGNVVGIMPHPERAVEAHICGIDGLEILGSI